MELHLSKFVNEKEAWILMRSMLVSILFCCLVGCAVQDFSELERAAQKKVQKDLLGPDKVFDLEQARRREIQKKSVGI